MRISERRAGFTLIEVLIVLGILLVLMSLGIGASIKAFGWVQRTNSEVVLRKVQERMQRRYDQIVVEARKWETSPFLYRLAGGTPRRAEALKIKLLYKWSFPMNYAEVITGIAESQAYGYSASGYPFLVALRNRLQSKMGNGAILASDRPGLRGVLGLTIGEDLRNQNSACMLAIFETTFGSSVDELAPSELGRYPDPPNPALNQPFDNNPLIVDAWGTPLFFMRYGNLVTGFNADSAADLCPFYWLTAVLGPTSGTTTKGSYGGTTWDLLFGTINGRYYSQIVDRAKVAFPLKFQAGTGIAVDPDDPESLLTLGWRSDTGSWWTPVPPQTWMPTPPAPGPGGIAVPLQNAFDNVGVPSGFTRTFGYRMSSSGTQIRIYAPLVVLSAGPDKAFSGMDPANPELGWDDNLDTYRLNLRVGEQQ